MNNKLLCPLCRIALHLVIFNEVEVDVCIDGCRGIWLDKAELSKIKGCNTESTDLYAGKRTMQSSIPSRHNNYKVLFCPRCNIDLDIQLYHSSHVEIDKCLSCDGVWLNYGDLQRINELIEDGWDPKSYQTALAMQEHLKKQQEYDTSSLKPSSDRLTRRKVLGAIFFVIDLLI